jgi:carboxylesterase
MKDYSFYREGTNGKGVLLVHGLTGAPAEMKFLCKRLIKRLYAGVSWPLLINA